MYTFLFTQSGDEFFRSHSAHSFLISSYTMEQIAQTGEQRFLVSLFVTGFIFEHFFPKRLAKVKSL